MGNELLNIHFDNQGLIQQTNGDSGDCAARTGELYTGLALNKVADYSIFKQVNSAIDLLEPTKDGILLRCNMAPYNDPFHGDFATCRDQTQPMIIMAGFYYQWGFLERLFKKQLKRFMFFQNGDPGSPEHLGNYIRAFYAAGYKKAAWFYPLLLVGDLFMLLNVLIRCWQGRNYDDVGDDLNCTQSVLQAVYSLPTPISWLARQIYKFRPFGVQHAFDWYHRPESFGNPINEVYRPLILKWLT